ncbi:potassium/sodium hyperpolarization-activated cyclic nucleotide-gated channel 2-like [Anoplophora glabripennis]|uniref:potassium/sodium hyperpolarization-activated cyclic nucleotide-gated channel 2-like n=1 Tax=Anoplophora glabripennis TaxID=217634 RepID=UPI000873975F|nr:potassium/sodium hyperpolarization-activated cyclic nucleotide-gated channel 2-like [Anoplophora glabripennis]
MPRFEDHDCMLTNLQEDVVAHFMESGIFITWRRKLRSLCMISRNHPETSRYFKSYASCRNEEVRHLVRHNRMIHPFSLMSLYWEFFTFFLFTALYAVVPIDASVLVIGHDHDIYLVKFGLDLMHMVDMVMIFFTGFYDEDKSKVIFTPGKIAKRYLKTYFIFDVLSCAHSLMLPIRLSVNVGVVTSLIIRTFGILKIIRITRWLRVTELFRQYMGYTSYLFKGVRVILVFLVVMFWAFAINFFVENFLTQYHVSIHTPEKDIFEIFFDATTTLMIVSILRDNMTHILEYINTLIFICFGFGLQLFVYAQIIQVWIKYANADHKRYSLHKQFKEYMKYKELPLKLQGRFVSYFQFKFHKYFFKDSDINNMISPFIRQEILMHVTRRHIEKVDFFRHLPENVLMKVVAQLKTEIYLAGDVIISAGTIGTSMFFIYHGTVAIFTPSGKEICHLEDGAHFGEIALILSETRVANVVAVTASELFTLRRTDFLEAIDPYPECKDQLMLLAAERLHKAITHT